MRRSIHLFNAGLTVTGILITAQLGGCKKPAPLAAPPAPPPQVAVVVAEAKTIPITYRFIGMTEPSKAVEVRSRITGFLLSRSFEEGKPIKAGDLLYTIDPRPFEADLQIARARQAQAEAQVKLADADLKRYTEASAAGAVAKSDLDKVQTTLIDAQASVNLAKAEVAKAELDLSYTRVMSPVTGVIGRALKDEGAYLDAGNNSLLAVATQTDPMYVLFSVPERDWLRWREQAQSGEIRAGYTNPDGSPVDIKNPNPLVKIELLDGTPYPVQGRMSFFDTKINAGTGSAMARATISNPDAQLKEGLFVHATIVGWERPNSIVVPQRAVLNNPGGSFVFMVNGEGVVEMHKVTLGDWKESGWLVLSGVKPGDVVIADGFAKARPGTKVTTVPYVESGAAAKQGPTEAGSPTADTTGRAEPRPGGPASATSPAATH